MYSEKRTTVSEYSNTRTNACSDREGSLPCRCAPLAFPYIPKQNNNPQRYEQRQALRQGTLFPGLDLPFREDMAARYPGVDTELVELMALDFAIDELGLYLVTHADDQEVLDLYWSYIRMAKEGRKKYESMHGPLWQTTVTEGRYRWLDDPWPWEKGGNQ